MAIAPARPATVPATSRPAVMPRDLRCFFFPAFMLFAFFVIADCFAAIALRPPDALPAASTRALRTASSTGASAAAVDANPLDARSRTMTAVGATAPRAAWTRGPTVAPAPFAACVAACLR